MRNCYNHPGMGATTVCEACGRGICAGCVAHVNDHVYCRDCADEERKNLQEQATSDQHVSIASQQPEPAPSAPVAKPTPTASVPETRPAPGPSPQEKPAPAAPVAMVPSNPAPVAPKAASSTPAPIAPAATGTGKPDGKKESLIAALLSLVVPGLGQVYDGHTKKGIVLAVMYFGLLVIIFACVVLFTLFGGIGAICCAPGLLFPALILLYAVYDAYNTAEKLNRGEETKDWL